MGLPLDSYLSAAAEHAGHARPLIAALERADLTRLLPLPGSGRTDERWRGLAATAAVDVTAARVLEPVVDAVAILAEAGQSVPTTGTTWGVFAAEAPGAALSATERDGEWVLDGEKPWCSLAGEVSHALVTASVGADDRRLFAVGLRQAGVRVADTEWVARGLAEVPSGPVHFDSVTARPVGEAAWYLTRPGFRWGAIGVAACWWGACLPIYDAVAKKTGHGTKADAYSAARLGELHRRLASGRLALRESASLIDAGALEDASVLAHGVRGTVIDAVDAALSCARDLLGPAALAFDEELARRCADLELYASQYHHGRDDASLAAHLEAGSLAW